MSKRQFIDDRLDSLRFLLDRRRLDYQPMPWLGVEKAPRSEGVRSRWEAISKLVEECGGVDAVDVGCNAGYYVISLALRGVPTVGVESDPRYARLLTYARGRLELDHVGVMTMRLTPATAGLVPRADVTLFLAVWHHLVRAHGLRSANTILSSLWSRTGRVLFFETGEDEIPAHYGLPAMGPEPGEYLEQFLRDHCPESRVEHLGRHAAFAPDRTPCKRNLFAVVRPEDHS